MKRIIEKLICIALGTMLFGTVGCFSRGTEQSEIISEATPAPENGEETIVVAQDPSADHSQLPQLTEPTAQISAETEQPTPEPTPKPTRAPIEGDVSTGRFPDYDTGTGADWRRRVSTSAFAISCATNCASRSQRSRMKT